MPKYLAVEWGYAHIPGSQWSFAGRMIANFSCGVEGLIVSSNSCARLAACRTQFVRISVSKDMRPLGLRHGAWIGDGE